MEATRQAPALFAPGPTYVPERLRLAMGEPLIHHRSPQFKVMFADIRERLARVWRAGPDWEPLVFACSGSGAMEAAVVNFMRRDRAALVISSGKFGERWSTVVRAYGCQVVEHKLRWGERVSIPAVEDVVRANPNIGVVYLTSADTSTGIRHPIGELCQSIRKLSDALIVVDCICDFGGGRPVRPLEWDCDALISSSQKCLLLPPGLGLAHLSPRAIAALSEADLPRFYFDWRSELAYQRDESITHFTSPVSLLRGLQEMLRMMEETGVEVIEQRYAGMGRSVRAGIEALGLEVFPDDPSDALTVVRCSPGLDGGAVISHLREHHGVQLGSGQDAIKGKVFRIGHMGVFGAREVYGLFGVLEATLAALGHLRCEPGASVAALARAFSGKQG